MPNVPTGLPESSPERQEFDALFQEITGINPDEAQRNDEGWLFMPPKTADAPKDKRGRLGDLAGPNGWKNCVIANADSGFWIQRPE